MVVGVARVTLHLPASQSLKDKRQVVRSILAQVIDRFEVAASEVDRHDQWQIAVIGIACISTAASHADERIAKTVGFIASRKLDAEVLDYETEIIHALT
jgi:uncharacterized protein YlxP (DUF503 family)